MTNETKTTNSTKWSFLAIHKSRIIKDGETYQLIKITETMSTILPKVFKRKKENEDYVFYSLPEDMKINVRTSFYSEVENKYVYNDKLLPLSIFMEKYKHILNKVLELE